MPLPKIQEHFAELPAAPIDPAGSSHKLCIGRINDVPGKKWISKEIISIEKAQLEM